MSELLESCEELTKDRTNRVYTDHNKALSKLILTEKLRELIPFLGLSVQDFECGREMTFM